MRQLAPSAVVMSIVTLILLLAALTASGVPQEANRTNQPAGGNADARYLPLPDCWQLQTENLQHELGLTDQQRQTLAAIGQDFYNQTRQNWAALGGPPADEQDQDHLEARNEIRQSPKDLARNEIRQSLKDLRGQVERLLTPDQLQRLGQINLRLRGTTAMADPKVLRQLELTEAQEKRLRQIRQQMQAEIRKLQQRALENTFEVLTVQQRETLQELIGQGIRLDDAAPAPGSP